MSVGAIHELLLLLSPSRNECGSQVPTACYYSVYIYQPHEQPVDDAMIPSIERAVLSAAEASRHLSVDIYEDRTACSAAELRTKYPSILV